MLPCWLAPAIAVGGGGGGSRGPLALVKLCSATELPVHVVESYSLGVRSPCGKGGRTLWGGQFQRPFKHLFIVGNIVKANIPLCITPFSFYSCTPSRFFFEGAAPSSKNSSPTLFQTVIPEIFEKSTVHQKESEVICQPPSFIIITLHPSVIATNPNRISPNQTGS